MSQTPKTGFLMTWFYFKEEPQFLKTGMIILIHYQREGFQNGMTLQPLQPSPHCVRVSLAEKTNSSWPATQPSHPHYLKSFYITDDIFLHLKRHLHHLYKNTNVSMLIKNRLLIFFFVSLRYEWKDRRTTPYKNVHVVFFIHTSILTFS